MVADVDGGQSNQNNEEDDDMTRKERADTDNF